MRTYRSAVAAGALAGAAPLATGFADITGVGCFGADVFGFLVAGSSSESCAWTSIAAAAAMLLVDAAPALRPHRLLPRSSQWTPLLPSPVKVPPALSFH